MNRIIFIMLLFPLLISAQKIDKEVYYDYSEKVEFRIHQLKKKKMIDRSINTIIAEKGRRFILMTLEFKNNTSETQIIDFEKFFLKDNNSELHAIDFVVMTMKFSGRYNKMQQKIKPNKKVKIVIEFRPSFDETEIIDTLIVDGKIIKLKYTE